MSIEAAQITILRNYEIVLSNISFAVKSGEALIVRGRNGTGKSTLLKALIGLLPIETGELTKIDSEECHYLAHENAMKSVLSVEENLKFYGGTKQAIESVLKKLDILSLYDIPYSHLSLGQARRVALARLLLIKKPIWILDEPTNGLDAESKSQFTQLMQEHLSSDGIIILTTHEDIGLANSTILDLDSH